MDDDSVSAFQNPSQTFTGSLGNVASEIENVQTVDPSHAEIPTEFKKPEVHVTPEPQLGPYGSMIHTGPSPSEIQAAQEKEERTRIISRLQRLNLKKNFPTIHFSEGDNLYTLRKLNRLATHTGRLTMTISFFKRATVFIARIMEGLCARYPNRFVELEGYSEFLLLNISQYDSLLEDIYDHYSDAIVEASPLLMYIGAIGSNMAVYSISRKLMKSTKAKEEKKRKMEQMQRDREIQEILRQRNRQSRKSGGGMSGPDETSELVDNQSVTTDFKSVSSPGRKVEVGSPSRSVTFDVPEEKAPPKEEPQTDENGRRKIDLS